jgi:3-isopropylmalate/(R)-2-methylmalate dehydratase small subunit
MEKFELLKGIAAPLPMMNVDTDMIIPKQFLKTIKRSGLGKNLFHELRFDMQGNIKNDFVLNWDPYKEASILIAGDNFGCGSSREHAPWSLLDFGFKCIIAPSFADIFYNNCFKNGILPIILNENQLDNLFKAVESTPDYKLVIDLETQTITTPTGEVFNFSVDAFRKNCLINGLDDIGITLEYTDEIVAYEQRRKQTEPWIFNK